jgi:hypothetical protein
MLFTRLKRITQLSTSVVKKLIPADNAIFHIGMGH